MSDDSLESTGRATGISLDGSYEIPSSLATVGYAMFALVQPGDLRHIKSMPTIVKVFEDEAAALSNPVPEPEPQPSRNALPDLSGFDFDGPAVPASPAPDPDEVEPAPAQKALPVRPGGGFVAPSEPAPVAAPAEGDPVDEFDFLSDPDLAPVSGSASDLAAPAASSGQVDEFDPDFMFRVSPAEEVAPLVAPGAPQAEVPSVPDVVEEVPEEPVSAVEEGVGGRESDSPAPQEEEAAPEPRRLSGSQTLQLLNDISFLDE